MKKTLYKGLISVLIMLLVTAHVPVRVFAQQSIGSAASIVERLEDEETTPETGEEAEESQEENKEEAALEAAEETAEKAVSQNELKAAKTEVKDSEEPVKTEVKTPDGNESDSQQKETEVKEKDKEELVEVSAKVSFSSRDVCFVYNGQKQSYDISDIFTVHYFIGNEEVTKAAVEDLGFTVSLKAYHPDTDTEDDDFTVSGTDANKYQIFARVRFTGKVEGYAANDNLKEDFVLVIDQAPVTVTYKGINQEITFDGQPHYKPGSEILIDDGGLGLYNKEYIVFKSVASEKEKTYTDVCSEKTGYTQAYLDSSARNTNSNFNVTFVAEQGTFEIKPATVTVKTESAREMSDGTDTQTLECHKYSIDGYLGKITDDYAKVIWGAAQVGVGYKDNECTFEFTADKDKKNYVITYDFGTLTIYRENQVIVTIRPVENKTPYSGDYQDAEIPLMFDIDNKNYGFENISYAGNENVVLQKGEGVLYVHEKEVGDYTVSLGPNDFVNTNDQFDVTFVVDGTALMHITPIYISVVLDKVTEKHQYTGEEMTIPSYVIKEVVQNDTEAPQYDTENIVYSGNKEIKGTEYGLYWETLDIEKFSNSDSNYNVMFGFASEGSHVSSLTITRPGVTVTLAGNEFHVAYDGQEHELIVNGDGSASVDGVKQSSPAFTVTNIKADDDASFNAEDLYFRKALTVSGKESGEYTVNDWLIYLSNTNQDIDISYQIEKDIALVVDRVPLTLVIDDKTIDYGDKVELTAHYEGLIEGFEGPAYELNVNDKIDHVGTYEISAELIEKSALYTVAEIINGTLTVNRKPLTVTVTGARKVVKYDGEEHELSGYTLTLSEETAQAFKQPVSPTVKGTEADDYVLDLSGLQFAFDESVYDITLNIENGLLKIVEDADPIDLGTITFNGGEFVFDGEEHPATMDTIVTVDGKTYTLSGMSLNYANGSEKVATPVDAGEYTVTLNTAKLKVTDENGYDVTELCNYKVQESATLTISPRPIIVYVKAEKRKDVGGNGGEYHYARYTITVEGNPGNSKDFTLSDVTYNGKDYAAVNYGTLYPDPPAESRTQLYLNNFGTSNNNYEPEFQFDGDGLIIMQLRYPGSGAITYINLTLDSETVEYDGQPHTYKPKIVELGDSDTMTVKGSDGVYYTITVNPDRLSGAITKTNAGTYTANGALSGAIISIVDSRGIDCSPAVAFKYTGGQFVITKQKLTVTIRDDIEKTYGENDPDRSTWIEVEGLKDGQSVLKIFNITRESGEDVGEYPIRVSLIANSSSGGGGGSEVVKKAAKSPAEAVEVAIESEAALDEEEKPNDGVAGQSNNNYEVTYRNTEGKLTINPAVVTITAVDDAKLYGEIDPEFTAIITGLIGNEHLPSGFFIEYRDPGEEIGDYVIHVEADPDYEDPDYPVIDDGPGEIICLDCEVICKDCEIVKDYEEQMEVVQEAARKYVEEAKEDVLKEEDKIEVSERPMSECESMDECEEHPWNPGTPVIIIDEPTTSGGGSGIFKSKNYEIVLVNGNFNISGKTNTDNPPDDPVTPPTPPTPPVEPPVEPTTPTVTPTPNVITIVEPQVDPEPATSQIDDEPAPAASTDLSDEPAPLAEAVGGRAWALVNLLCTVASVLTALAMILTMSKKEDEEEDKEEVRNEDDEDDKQGRKYSKLLGLIPGIGAVIAFILTEDIRLPMTMVDKWTLLMVIILAISLISAYLTRNKNEDDDEDEDKGNADPQMQAA